MLAAFWTTSDCDIAHSVRFVSPDLVRQSQGGRLHLCVMPLPSAISSAIAILLDRAAAQRQPFLERLAGRLAQLELDRPSGLLLHRGGVMADLPAPDDVADPELHQVAAAQLAVDGQVEQCAVARGLARPPRSKRVAQASFGFRDRLSMILQPCFQTGAAASPAAPVACVCLTEVRVVIVRITVSAKAVTIQRVVYADATGRMRCNWSRSRRVANGRYIHRGDHLSKGSCRETGAMGRSRSTTASAVCVFRFALATHAVPCTSLWTLRTAPMSAPGSGLRAPSCRPARRRAPVGRPTQCGHRRTRQNPHAGAVSAHARRGKLKRSPPPWQHGCRLVTRRVRIPRCEGRLPPP